MLSVFSLGGVAEKQAAALRTEVINSYFLFSEYAYSANESGTELV